jgi:Zn-dependent metalloprotease
MCCSHHVCCFIAPPDLLARLAKEGSPEQRDAAIRTLATSAVLRNRRSLVTHLIRQGADVQALGLCAPPSAENRSVYDVDHGGQSDLPGRLVRREGQGPVADESVNEAYDGADKTYEFYKDAYSRNSVDDRGLALISSVHFGTAFDNAFWNGGEMVYGDGSGQLFIEGGLTKAIDVIGHELTHGVTQFTAGLEYHDQPGALNESFSDVFGSLVKQYALGQTADEADWLIGEGILVPSLGNALRSMKEPGTAFQGDTQPGHMRDYQDLPNDNDPANDNGGVHINSGIPNHAFYLAATAIGGNAWEVAGKIWYETLTKRLQPDAQFSDAAAATVAVAGELFGDDEVQAVRGAWDGVGVGVGSGVASPA